jgi:hypothetical protein
MDEQASDPMRSSTRELTAEAAEQVKVIKGMGAHIYKYLDTLTPSREVSLAKTKCEEMVMWATKAVTG